MRDILLPCAVDIDFVPGECSECLLRVDDDDLSRNADCCLFNWHFEECKLEWNEDKCVFEVPLQNEN